MLKYNATNDKELLNSLHQSVFGGVYPKDIGFVLYYGDIPIGIAQMVIDKELSILQKVGILEEYRNKKFGDFFTRSLIWGLSQASKKVQISYENEYFKKFGFSAKNGIMIADSEKIVFPCECHK